MAAADRKITYTAAEVAELIRPLTQSVEALQKENAELKQKLEHMNEILANAQRARFGQSSEKKTYVLSEDQMSLFNEAEICQDSKAEEPTEETLTVKAHARKKKRTIDELAKNLPVEEIEDGTMDPTVYGVQKGCAFVRVHDVEKNKRAIRMTRALMREHEV